MDCGKQVGGIVFFTVIGMCGFASPGRASQLVVPATSAQDASLVGNAVALPLNAVSALFHNPAQLTLLPESVTTSMLGFRFQPSYESLSGYDETSREPPVAPSFGYVTDRWAPFHLGIGMYGALGFAYNFDADPAHGVPNNLVTELAVLSLAPAIAYSFTPNFHVGLALNPSYGRLRLKSPTPIGRMDVDVRGPGMFGTVGFLYTPTPRVSLGLGYKTPGMLLMRGNARIAGRGDDAKVDFYIPQGLEFGVAYYLTDRLTITTQGRWTEYTVFEDTRLEFDRHTVLNQSPVTAAKDRFRAGAGAQYRLFSHVTVQVGFSWEPWAISASSLSPLLPDVTDYSFTLGFHIEHGLWEFHVMAGGEYTEDRRISAQRNAFFPGRYSLDNAIFGFQVTRRLGEQ